MAAVTVAPRLRRAAADDEDDDVGPVEGLLVVDAAILRAVDVAVAGRVIVVGRALSTMLWRMLLATTALPGVMAGRAMPDLPGVAATRGAILELDVVGDRAWPGLRETEVVVLARNLF